MPASRKSMLCEMAQLVSMYLQLLAVAICRPSVFAAVCKKKPAISDRFFMAIKYLKYAKSFTTLF